MENLERFDQSIVALIGKSGGHNATYFEIVGIAGEGMTQHFPSIDAEGREIPYSFENEAVYWKNKTKRQRYTVRLIVAGNGVSAESALKDLGWTCFATGTESVDLYVDPSLVQNADLSEQ